MKCLFLLLILCLIPSLIYGAGINISALPDGGSTVDKASVMVGNIGSRTGTTSRFTIAELFGLYFGTLTSSKFCTYNAYSGKIDCTSDGTDNYAAAGDLAFYMPLSTFTAAGDVPVGSASGAVTVISKGSNNTFFGVNNAGTLGFHDSFNPVFVSAPTSDDTYSGTVASFVAGEALAQWDVVYCKNKAGVHACYKYDANGADKALPPRAMAVAAINADASGTFLLTGIVRNDGWSQTTNQDEGKLVYADGTTAGAITLTKSTTSADMIAILGYVVEQNVIYFNPSPILVEVP